jgi:hypothetical protein
MSREQLFDSTVLPKTRREFLEQAGAAGFALPVLTIERERHTGPFRKLTWDLLPVDDAATEPVRVVTEALDGADTVDTQIVNDQTQADPQGRTSFGLQGTLDGEGRIGMKAMPWLASRWTAPSTGEYDINAVYSVEGEYLQEPIEGADTSVAMTAEPNVAILDESGGVAKEQSMSDIHLINGEPQDEADEEIVEFLAYRLVAPYLGPIGRLIAKFVIELSPEVFEISEGTIGGRSGKTGRIEYEFEAEEGETYEIRFTTPGGFVGKAPDDDVEIRSILSADYTLESFWILRKS